MMSILWLLIPVSSILAISFIGWFIWAVKTGQYDDLETPAQRILFDDEDENGSIGRK